jgi:hypothetical protein
LNVDPPSAPSHAEQTDPSHGTDVGQTDNMADMGVDDLMAMLDEELSATKKGG